MSTTPYRILRQGALGEEAIRAALLEELCIIGLGEIYAYGLGVPQDIKRGMEYWNKLPQDERVLEHKQNFKKTLFGWKQK